MRSGNALMNEKWNGGNLQGSKIVSQLPALTIGSHVYKDYQTAFA